MYDWRLQLAKITGLSVGNFSRLLRLGSGSVLPGRFGLALDPHVLQKTRLLIKQGCIFITGTNGKSTTTYYISTILRTLGYSVLTNYSGANMRAGVASACLAVNQPVDYGVFEVDEASLPRLAEELQPTHVICLNFSRDQLDRYSEIEMLVGKIAAALYESPTELIYNYANPYSALLGEQIETAHGYLVKSQDPCQAIDVPICHDCEAGLLRYMVNDREHTILACTNCGAKYPNVELVARYNDGLLRFANKAVGAHTIELAETLAACVLLCQRLGLAEADYIPAIERTVPLSVHRLAVRDTELSASVELLLGKNPDSFGRMLRDIIIKKPSQVVLAINDNFADSIDTSWLWDIDFRALRWANIPIYIIGLAKEDVLLRLKVLGIDGQVREMEEVNALWQRNEQRTLILANYTAYRTLEKSLHNVLIVPKSTGRFGQPTAVPLLQPRYEYQ